MMMTMMMTMMTTTCDDNDGDDDVKKRHPSNLFTWHDTPCRKVLQSCQHSIVNILKRMVATNILHIDV